MVVKILQKVNYFTQQQRIKLHNTQIMKKYHNDVFLNVYKNDQFSQKTKIDENSNKKWQLKNNSLYVNKRIYISSKKIRNLLFTQNHDDYYGEHFESEKSFKLIRRKNWWFNLVWNVKKIFKILHWLLSNQIY